MLLTIPAAVLISALLLFAVPLLYGTSFHQTTPLGFILLPGVLLLGIGKVLSSAIAGRAFPRYCALHHRCLDAADTRDCISCSSRRTQRGELRRPPHSPTP